MLTKQFYWVTSTFETSKRHRPTSCSTGIDDEPSLPHVHPTFRASLSMAAAVSAHMLCGNRKHAFSIQNTTATLACLPATVAHLVRYQPVLRTSYKKVASTAVPVENTCHLRSSSLPPLVRLHGSVHTCTILLQLNIETPSRGQPSAVVAVGGKTPHQVDCSSSVILVVLLPFLPL